MAARASTMAQTSAQRRKPVQDSGCWSHASATVEEQEARVSEDSEASAHYVEPVRMTDRRCRQIAEEAKGVAGWSMWRRTRWRLVMATALWLPLGTCSHVAVGMPERQRVPTVSAYVWRMLAVATLVAAAHSGAGALRYLEEPVDCEGLEAVAETIAGSPSEESEEIPARGRGLKRARCTAEATEVA